MSFKDFNLHEKLQDGLESMGFETPTPVQEQAIPIIQQHRDLIACAQTGTGKTAAFVLPILDHLSRFPSEYITSLIVVPTRELALQIDNAIQGFSYFTGASSIAIYGGGDGQVFAREKKALVEGANVIIATPGRLLAHLNMGYVPTNHLKHLILDEADRMLDMGFFDDLMRIVSHLPSERQTLMFSATMPEKIRVFARKLLKDPLEISLSISKPAEGVKQLAYSVFDNQKNKLILDLLEKESYGSVIIFVSTKSAAKDLDRDLRRLKLRVAAIHSDLEQNEREDVLMKFKSKQTDVLVATDILSRGIDIDDIGLVINYDVPHDAEDYVHRVGRTARAESKGVAITFINPASQYKFSKIEKFIGNDVPKQELPAFLGQGPTYDPNTNKSSSKRPSQQGKSKRNFKGNNRKFENSNRPPQKKSEGES